MYVRKSWRIRKKVKTKKKRRYVGKIRKKKIQKKSRKKDINKIKQKKRKTD